MNEGFDREPPASSPEPIPKRQQEPLYIRMYYQEHLTELVRLFGYREIPADDALKMVQPLIEKYGRPKMMEATKEIVLVDCSRDPPMTRLTDHARKLAIQILGSPPKSSDIQGTPESTPVGQLPGVSDNGSSATPSAAIPESSITDPPQSDQSRNKSRRSEKRKRTKASKGKLTLGASAITRLPPGSLSRKVARWHFRIWLTDTKQEFVTADSAKCAEFIESNRRILDFILYGKPVNRLVAVRKTLTAAQTKEMQEWQRVFGTAFESVRAWPENGADGSTWRFHPIERIVAATTDELKPTDNQQLPAGAVLDPGHSETAAAADQPASTRKKPRRANKRQRPPTNG